MTESEAVAHLQASPGSRRRRVLVVAIASALIASVATMLLFVWVWDEPWDRALVRGATWFVLGALVAWWLASSNSMSKVAASVDEVVPAELTKVDGQRVIVRQNDGTELVWTVQSPRKLSLDVGQDLWLGSPVRRGEHVLAVVDQGQDDGEATILWPLDAAWSPGRWD